MNMVLEPITREEHYLAKAGGQNVQTPIPITRQEMFLDAIAKREPGGGIDVTASVGQTIVVEEVDANGKPTKWKAADYQPRTHGFETVEILPETEAVYSDEEGIFLIETDMLFVEGETYFINWNGTLYTCVAQENNGVGVGNVDLANGIGDTGEPFVMFADAGVLIIMPLYDSATVTVAIEHVAYTPIPVPYVTNALPYYIEATAEWDGLTNNKPTNYVFHDTYQNVAKAYSQGRDIKLRVRLTGTNTNNKLDAIYTLVCGSGDTHIYLFVLPVSNYENTHMHAIAMVGSFEAALLIAPTDADGTLGIYEY